MCSRLCLRCLGRGVLGALPPRIVRPRTQIGLCTGLRVENLLASSSRLDAGKTLAAWTVYFFSEYMNEPVHR